MTSLGVLLAIAVLIALAVFGMRRFARKLHSAAEEMAKLALHGKATTAQISAVERRRMARGEYNTFVTYDFTDWRGNEHSKEHRVSGPGLGGIRLANLRQGLSIDIVYLPDNPTVSATRDTLNKVSRTRGGSGLI